MSDAAEVIARARSVVGVRFRPQGRDPSTGLDCVGVVTRAFAIPAETCARDYRMRGEHLRQMHRELSKRFCRVGDGCRAAADILICAVRADQMHLVIECDGSFIHADAGLRRVVETPGEPPWPIVATFRAPHLCQSS